VTETGRDSDAIRLGNSSSPRRLRQILRTIHELVARAVADRLRTRSSLESARPGPARPGRSDGTGPRPGASQPAALRPAANVGWFLGRVEAGFESSWGERVALTWRFWTKYESIWAQWRTTSSAPDPYPLLRPQGSAIVGFAVRSGVTLLFMGRAAILGNDVFIAQPPCPACRRGATPGPDGGARRPAIGGWGIGVGWTDWSDELLVLGR